MAVEAPCGAVPPCWAASVIPLFMTVRSSVLWNCSTCAICNDDLCDLRRSLGTTAAWESLSREVLLNPYCPTVIDLLGGTASATHCERVMRREARSLLWL